MVKLWGFDIHTRPSLCQYAAELPKPVWIVMPNVSKVPGCGVVEKGKAGCFLSEERFVVIDGTENRHEANRAIEFLTKGRGGLWWSTVSVRYQVTGTSFREVQLQFILI